MDRTKYGRRLTFLNAYFSAAVAIAAYCGMLLVLWLIGELSPLFLLWGMRPLLHNVWNACRQIIELRAGLLVEDNRTVYPTSGHYAFRTARFRGLGILGLVAFLFFIFRQESNPVSDSLYGKLLVEVLLSVGGVWGMLWLDRAIWEWRALEGKVHSSEWVERVSEEADAGLLPQTETGMKRYVREATWLCRIGAWLMGILLFLPGLPLFSSSLFSAALIMAINLGILLFLVPAWSRVREKRDACQKKLKETQAPVAPLLTKVIEDPAPVYQQLRP
ncbi:MAG: hypothetical protein QM758_08365 [Armatimonas sp.]